ncbi:MAG: PHP-associated domain-containing protein [Anaerovoracaceae bacterium]
MRFDLHCHTKKGSLDSSVSLERYIELFREKQFDGIMIADHNSYKGCRVWDELKKYPQYADFTVIKGLEYDTRDAGHILVIMPDKYLLPVLAIRGMNLKRLLKIVHRFGGILGPAHPFGVRSSSAMYFRKMNMDLIERFDFIETFNTCESPLSNQLARELADEYNLPHFGGSDAHVEEYVGMAYTDFDADIRCNNDLIRSVKDKVAIKAGGTERGETVKGKRKEHWTGVWGYKLYNRGVGKLIYPYRKYLHFKLPFRS